jgi:dTDP-4-amino-4,6-dideoxygalactose transaminase
MNVTKTYLPPIEEYTRILQRAWDKNWLTNRGELVQELEQQLKDFLDVRHLTLTTNGTLPIQIAIKALDLKGEIITTPFSYVATTSSIAWEGCKPVFVDIHPEYLTIDEKLIEVAITENTSAILATHVFGNPCHVEAIEAIAQKHNLKVIYDAAHCFGVSYLGKSLLSFGDVSTCSFHATKILHTGEGGCYVTNDKDLGDKLDLFHNFGHQGADIVCLGTNAKMSELQAAMGLAVFAHFEEIKEGRKKAVERYDEVLNVKNSQRLKLREGTDWNYHYYPLILESFEQMIKVKHTLNESGVFPRRYFYPSLNKLNYVQKSDCPISESISSRILCLPLHSELTNSEIDKVCRIIDNVK